MAHLKVTEMHLTSPDMLGLWLPELAVLPWRQLHKHPWAGKAVA